jgi:hypothetical protein
VSPRAAAVAPALVLLGIGALMVHPISDPDLWWLLAGGRYMIEHRAFLTTDPFSAVAGAPWLNHAWGFELLLHAVHRVGGTTGLIALQALFAVGTFAGLYRAMRRDEVDRVTALGVLVLAAFATRGFWEPRPQLITFAMMTAFWVILREHARGARNRLAWLLPLTILWVNLHAGFAIGLALVALALVAEVLGRLFGEGTERGDRPAPGTGATDWRAARRLAAVGIACAAATLVNPFHVHAALFPFQVVREQVGQAMIIEWRSPPFSHPQATLIELLVLAALVLLLWRRRPAAWLDVLALAAFIHLGLHAIRNLPLLVLILTPILGALATPARRQALPGVDALRARAVRHPGLAAAVLAIGLATTWWLAPADARHAFTPRVGVEPGAFPDDAIAFLEREPREGILFNEYIWGGYLIWRLYPRYRVWIDGRAAVHGPVRLVEYYDIDEVRPRWRTLLDRSGVELVLVNRASRLGTVLRTAPDWEVLYEDAVAVVLAKRKVGS